MRRLAYLFVGLIIFIPTSAHADPNPSEPSTLPVSMHTARKITRIVTRDDLAIALAGPRHHEVGECWGTEMIRKCRAKFSNNETKCRYVMWIWQDEDTYYYEFHNLNCKSKEN